MKWFNKVTGIFLSGAILLGLCGCGVGSDPYQVVRAYQSQRTVSCTIQYSICFDATIAGIAVENLEQNFAADAQVDLTTGQAHLLGDMNTLVDGESVGETEVESYASPEDADTPAYYRYGTTYFADEADNAYLTIINAPMTLNLGLYEKSAHSEILNGSVCDIYTGREIADAANQTFVSSLVEGDISLLGCIIDVTLRVYQGTSLPAQMEISYSNLDEMDISFSDAQGNSYTLKNLSYKVLYGSYGTEVSVEVPEGFKEAALNGKTASESVISDDSAELSNSSADIDSVLGREVTGYTGDRDADFTDSFFIFNEDSSYFYAVDTPEFMEFDEQEQDYVSFYYYYAENDFELISYCLYSDFTAQDEITYAESLADYYGASEGISNVSESGVQSITIGAYDVQYNIVYYTLTVNGEDYDTVDIYSWVQAPNGVDCLEVTITEYNASGDGVFVDAVEELQYAYAAILGSGALN